MMPLHEAQLLPYLRLGTCRIGLLINFNTISLTDGLRRSVL
jgi:GxxExxY protein